MTLIIDQLPFFISVITLSDRDSNTYLYNYLTVHAFLVAKAKLSLTFARFSVFFLDEKLVFHLQNDNNITLPNTLRKEQYLVLKNKPLDKVDPPQFPSDEDPQWAQD